MGPGPSLMLLKGYEVRDRGGIVFSVAAERLWGLDMIMQHRQGSPAGPGLVSARHSRSGLDSG